ncbi:MAG: MmgE/PrpD family protein [Pseudomonadota bacterium]
MSDQSPTFLAAWDCCTARAGRPLPTAAYDAARRSWFDTLAVTAAGITENSSRASARACTLLDGVALFPSGAALVLGTASHALDYDDVCMLATCHPSAPIVSALMGCLPLLARERPAMTWRDLLSAYLVGTETMLRLGAWLGFRHYALGFHATGTLGTVGSAAAVAHAMQLPRAQAHAALSIAASSAAGLRANFGTDVKPLHVGMAAAAGVRAASFARAGIGASDDVWEAAGFALAFNGGSAVAALAWYPDTEWAIVQPGFELKRYPSCYLSHRLIAGILAIRARQPQAARGQPVDIDIEVAHNGLAALKYPQPRTGLQGKFSGPYCAAAAWLDGAVGLGTFSDDAVRRPLLHAGMRRVTLSERSAPSESLDTAPVQVTVRGAGWRDAITVDWAPGSLSDPMSRVQQIQKAQDCVAHGGAMSVEQILPLLDGPLDMPVSALLPMREALLRRTSQFDSNN